MSKQAIQLTDGSNNIFPVSAESGTNYCKMADGTLICWGLSIIPANQWSNNIYFPIAFVNSSYSVMLNGYDNVGGRMWASYYLTIDHCTCYTDSLYSSDRYFMWFAIGRWK